MGERPQNSHLSAGARRTSSKRGECGLLQSRNTLGTVNPALAACKAGPVESTARRACGMKDNTRRSVQKAGRAPGHPSGCIPVTGGTMIGDSAMPVGGARSPLYLGSGVHVHRGNWSHTIRRDGAAGRMRASRSPMQWQLPCPAGLAGCEPAPLRGARHRVSQRQSTGRVAQRQISLGNCRLDSPQDPATALGLSWGCRRPVARLGADWPC